MNVKNQEELLEQYKKDSDDLIKQMEKLLIRVYRKADDANYRRTLEKLNYKNNG